MEIQYGNLNNLYLLIVVTIGVGLVLYAMIARRQAAKRFSHSNFRNVLSTGSSRRHQISSALVLASLALTVLALVDIRWGETTQSVPQKGIEVMFALDVSRSMLAEDVTPNRLERAKQQIGDMLEEMTGDRVGLLVFAGETKQVVPLTTHYEDFKQVLETVDPYTVHTGGSLLGAAIQAASEGFMDKTNDHKTIVIFTDGEDQESHPVELAKQLHRENGTRIFTVGLGDMDRGSRIPAAQQSNGGRFVMHEGQQVWSKMNGDILSQIATETQGVYIPAGTKQVDMGDVYHRFIANVEQTEFESAIINSWIPRFQWFAIPALALIITEAWLTTRPAKTNPPKPPHLKTG